MAAAAGRESWLAGGRGDGPRGQPRRIEPAGLGSVESRAEGSTAMQLGGARMGRRAAHLAEPRRVLTGRLGGIAVARVAAAVAVMFGLATRGGAAPPVANAESGTVRPFESINWTVPATPIDAHVGAVLKQKGIQPANPCSDEVFVRRVFLDAIGTLPRPEEIKEFLADRRPDKRAKLIDALLARPEFADYWTLKWCDILRVKAEFPVNLWPNAVQAYHRWVLDNLWANRPYDQFARDLLTASGSNFRVPPVNFYRAMQGRTPAAIAEVVALTFMGSRIDKWPAPYREGLQTLFSRVRYKSTGEWKEEIVCPDPTPTEVLKALLPDGSTAIVEPGEDPRVVFAAWLINGRNPWFACNIVNRIWSWLMGRGIVHEPDDLRPDNPPVNPALLAYLQQELVNSRWDLRHIYRLILNSQTYQLSSIPRSKDPAAEPLFAHYAVRRLDAEVLADALFYLTGDGDSYSSPIPEPFTFIPKELRSITLADGSITSPFLEMFGRPSRDTGLESERNNNATDEQRLHLLNSGDVQRRLNNCELLKQLIKSTQSNRPAMIRSIYLTVVSRYPTDAELEVADKYCQTPGLWINNAAIDLVWALINTKEFLYRH